MNNLKEQIQQLLELAGFSDPSIHFDEENRKAEIFLSEGEWFKRWLPTMVSDFNHVVKLLAKRAGFDNFFIDVNNYRKEREYLIVELAKAAAKKASTENQTVRLPAMNAYERRLIHVELAIRP
ncbi:MAG: hypothetical protein COU27_00015, partial [Candidatus Levybacteria bacterium CG10_big_fil_rev_8_21_14_0_10_36_7]